MSEPPKDPQCAVQNESKEKLACHLAGEPKIVLTRIDEQAYIQAPIVSTSPMKKPLKRLNVKKKLFPKSTVNSKVNVETGKRPRGRPRKIDKIESNMQTNTNKPNNKVNVSTNNRVKIEVGTVKSLLNKTMLQKRSKVIIPPATRSRVLPNRGKRKVFFDKPKSKVTPIKSKPNVPVTKEKKTVKVPQVKPSPPPKIKVDTPPTKPVENDLSDDEFLYDELIEELENPPPKKVKLIQNNSEKKTNITLKPNIDNKPPTIVKGGIVKKSNLPADLIPMAAVNGFNDSRSPLQTTNIKATPASRIKQPTHINSGGALLKKSSPWPVTITPAKPNTPKKQPTISSGSKSKPQKIVEKPLEEVYPTPSIMPKKHPTVNSGGKSKPQKILEKPLGVYPTPSIMPEKHSTINSGGKSKPQKVGEKPLKEVNPAPSTKAVSEPTPKMNHVSFEKARPRIGPKQTAKVVPLSKSNTEDDSLSDEYTEEERLDDPDSVFPNTGKPADEINNTTAIYHKPTLPASNNSIKDDEDSHIDLLRILTDEADDHPALKLPEAANQELGQLNKNGVETNIMTKVNEVLKESVVDTINNSPVKHVENEVAVELEPSKEPQPRTIYELMNEVSLQHPSWNLHIIPENNSFCIAQVTRGRLGLPTLKKCIELDPENYNAKVYIHQYHIKRFDGVYDSEESILALFNEINNIKA